AVGETVTLQVVHSDGTAEGGAGHEPWNVIADEFGEVHSTWYVATDDSMGSRFTLTATGCLSGSAQATFTDAGGNPSANLDQCANDPSPSSHLDGCSSSANDWVNGNLGQSKSVYLEGDSIPYRLRFDNLSTAASHTVTIEWDTTKSGTHAIDYITTFNRTVGTANPCLGVSGCNPSNFNVRTAIPPDTQVTGAGAIPSARWISIYGGAITNLSTYSYANGTGFSGDKSARITVTFTASVANPVLVWGGHIATRVDWPGASAINIPGSPYHTRLIGLDGN